MSLSAHHSLTTLADCSGGSWGWTALSRCDGGAVLGKDHRSEDGFLKCCVIGLKLGEQPGPRLQRGWARNSSEERN